MRLFWWTSNLRTFGFAASFTLLFSTLGARAADSSPLDSGDVDDPRGVCSSETRIAPELLPSDHRIWEDLESLWNRGGLSDLPIFTRPLPRPDVARSFVESLRLNPELASLAASHRVARELAREIEAIEGRPETTSQALFEAQEEDVRLRIHSVARLVGRYESKESHADEGTRAGLRLDVALGSSAFGTVDVAVERILDETNLGDSIIKGTEWYFNSDRAALTWRTSVADFTLGLDRNRWGPGATGTLLLSDAAPSYGEIVWARSFGRRARFTAVTGSLHAPSGRWFSAHRLDLSILPGLRLAFHEASAYSSDGIDLIYATNLIPYTIVQRLFDRSTPEGTSIAEQRNNLMAGAEMAWRFAPGWRVDGEFLLDEVSTESSKIPHRLAGQAAVRWSGRFGSKSTEAHLEFAKVYQSTYAVFYGANFIHDDLPLGYLRGPDVELLETRFDVDLHDDVRLGAGFELERHGEGRTGDFWDPAVAVPLNSGSDLTGVIQRTAFPHLRARWLWRDHADSSVRLGWREIKNSENVAGEEESGAHATLDLRWEW